MTTWTRSATGSPDAVRHHSRKWGAGTDGIEAVQIATAVEVVDLLSKQFPDLVQYVHLSPEQAGKDAGKIELPVERTELSVTVTGDFEKDQGGSISVAYSLNVPQRTAKTKVPAGGRMHEVNVIERSGAGVGP